MKFEPLSIDGAFKITPEKILDDRGAFARVYCDDEFTKRGLNTRWAQMNTSLNTEKGTVRGLHFQRPPYAEAKLVRCVKGQVFDVLVDLRARSNSYGRVCAITLDGVAMESVYIPEGCAHGYQTLTEAAELHYCHSMPYHPASEGAVNLRDPELAIEWPLPIKNMSERDAAHPSFKSTTPVAI